MWCLWAILQLISFWSAYLCLRSFRIIWQDRKSSWELSQFDMLPYLWNSTVHLLHRRPYLIVLEALQKDQGQLVLSKVQQWEETSEGVEPPKHDSDPKRMRYRALHSVSQRDPYNLRPKQPTELQTLPPTILYGRLHCAWEKMQKKAQV